MLVCRSYNPIPGTTFFFHPSLNGVNVLSVDRVGFGQDEVSSLTVPSNTQFNHIASRLIFDPTIPFEAGNKIQVLYEK